MRSFGRRCIGASVVGGMALVGLAAVPADAVTRWQPTQVVSGGDQAAMAPQILVTPRGDALAVWDHRVGRVTAERIRVARRPAGGTWSRPRTLGTTYYPGGAGVAMDSRGDAVVAWYAVTSGGFDVEASFGGGGGGWSSPVTLARTTDYAGEPQVAMDSGGDAVVVWTAGSQGRVMAASRPAGGRWRRPVRLSTPGPVANYPVVAMDARGDTTVAWNQVVTSTTVNIQAVRLKAGGTWTQPVTMPAATPNAEEPELATNARGDTVLAWQWFSADGKTEGVQAVRRPAGSSWRTPHAVTSTTKYLTLDNVAIDAKGDAVVAWELVGRDEVFPSFAVQVARSPAHQPWRSPKTLTHEGDRADVAMDARGDAVVVWQNIVSGHTVQAARLPLGGSWSAPTTLSGRHLNASGPQVALDRAGNAVAVWSFGHSAVRIASRLQTSG